MTSAQIRAARGLLNWGVRELDKRAGVHWKTVSAIVAGDGDPYRLWFPRFGTGEASDQSRGFSLFSVVSQFSLLRISDGLAAVMK